jgi:predicted small secreted protein
MESMMRLFTLFVSVLSALSLSGCETMSKMGENFKSIEMPDLGLGQSTLASGTAQNGLVASSGADCPQVKGLTDLSSISQFSNPKSPSADKLVATSKLEAIGASCQVAGNAVTVELAFDFSGTLGPVGVKDLNGQANYPYFLTVISPDGSIMSKDVFALSMIYENKQISVRKQDKLRQVIPLMAGQKANEIQIIVGFQLSDDELAYNRSRKP